MLFWHGFVLLLTEGAVLPSYGPTLNRLADAGLHCEARNWRVTSNFQVGLAARVDGMHGFMSIWQATVQEEPLIRSRSGTDRVLQRLNCRRLTIGKLALLSTKG